MLAGNPQAGDTHQLILLFADGYEGLVLLEVLESQEESLILELE